MARARWKRQNDLTNCISRDVS